MSRRDKVMIAGGFIPRLWSRSRVITSLRDVPKYPLCPGHKCPGYTLPPRWGAGNLKSPNLSFYGASREAGDVIFNKK